MSPIKTNGVHNVSSLIVLMADSTIWFLRTINHDQEVVGQIYDPAEFIDKLKSITNDGHPYHTPTPTT